MRIPKEHPHAPISAFACVICLILFTWPHFSVEIGTLPQLEQGLTNRRTGIGKVLKIE